MAKWNGPNAKRKPGHLQGIKAMAKVAGRDVLPEVRLPNRNKRKPETKKRDMAEKKIESDMIYYLNNRHCKAGKMGEMSTYNSNLVMTGLPDILCFHLLKEEVWFIEVKTDAGRLRRNQAEFANMCMVMGLNYVLARKMEDLWIITR